MPRKLEDVLRSRRNQTKAIIQLTRYRDEIDTCRELLKVLGNACTANEIPSHLWTNALLASHVDDRLGDLGLGLKGVQRLIRGGL